MTARRTVIGIDPGKDGCVAAWSFRSRDDDGAWSFHDANPAGILAAAGPRLVDLVLLERPSPAHARKGRREAPRATATAFLNYGRMLGALEVLGLTFHEVAAVAWKRTVGLPAARGDTEHARRKDAKGKAVALARRMFGTEHLDGDSLSKRGGRAEAMLLAWLARKKTERTNDR